MRLSKLYIQFLISKYISNRNCKENTGAAQADSLAKPNISKAASRFIPSRTSTLHCIIDIVGEVSYGAAKAALDNYTMAAAFELAPFGITATMVYPPVMDTGWITDQVRASVKQRPELLHIVEPADGAEVIVYLCTNHARLITANIIHLR